MADSQGVDYQREELAEAIAYGAIFPPDRKVFKEAVRIPGIDRVRALRGKGPVFSLRMILSWTIPTVVILLLFVMLKIVLPDGVPLFNDWFWVLTLPPVFAIPFRFMLSSMTGFDDMVAHLGKYGFQTKWLIRAALPERVFGRTVKNRVQLINVVSCHPSPSAGRSGDSYEVEPAIVTLGLRPLSKFPTEDDPVNNDVIVDPRACADDSHPPQVVYQSGDDGDRVDDYVIPTVGQVRDDRYHEDLAFMKNHGVHEAAVTDFSGDDLIIDVDDDSRKEVV